MSGVKRYDLSGYGGGMVEIDDGAWVHVDDYDRDTASLHGDYNEECADAMEVARKLHTVETERDQLRAQVEAMRGQVEGLKDVLAGAHAWMEDATSKVLYPIALHGNDRVAMEAEGLGSCTPDLFKSIDAALQANP